MLRRINARKDASTPQPSHPDGPRVRDFKNEAWFISALARASSQQKPQVDRSKEPAPFLVPERARANPRPLPPIPQRIKVQFQKPIVAVLRNKRVLDVKKMGFVDCLERTPKFPFGPEVLEQYPSAERLARDEKKKSRQAHCQLENLIIRMQCLGRASLSKEMEAPDVV